MPAVPAALLIATAVLYVRGAARGIDRRRSAAFLSGWLLTGLAVASPLHGAGEVRLSAHMIQHVILLSAAAPLIVWSRPSGALLRGLPERLRRAGVRTLRAVAPARRWLTGLALATALQAVVLWTWHMPGLYEAGVRHGWVHAVQHASLFGTALLFWSSIHLNARRGAAPAGGIAALFITTLHMGILSALFTFSRYPWYDVYALRDAGVALGDQQVAGLVMWVPGSAPYIVAALLLLWRLLVGSPAHSARREHPHSRYAALPIVRSVAIAAVLAVPSLSLSGCDRPAWDEGAAIAGGDPHSGKVLIERYGCVSCHIVPGVPGEQARVGPELRGLRDRVYVAGVVANSPSNLIRWIQDPQSIDSLTAMPNLGVTEAQARDIASYLYSLR